MASIIYNAEKYSKLSRCQRHSIFQHLAKHYDFLAALPYPAKVLDVGCGTGENTRLLAYFLNITEIAAFDIGPDMIEFAKFRNIDSKIDYYVADAKDFSTWPANRISQGSITLATSFYVLHWVDDNESAVTNIFRALKPGGYFMARLLGQRLPSDVALYDFVKHHPKWCKYSPKQQMQNSFWMGNENPAKIYGEMLSKIGFEEISYQNVELSDGFFADKDAVKEYITMSRLHHFNVPEEEFEEFVEQCTDVFMKAAEISTSSDVIRMSPIWSVDILAQKPQ